MVSEDWRIIMKSNAQLPEEIKRYQPQYERYKKEMIDEGVSAESEEIEIHEGVQGENKIQTSRNKTEQNKSKDTTPIYYPNDYKELKHRLAISIDAFQMKALFERSKIEDTPAFYICSYISTINHQCGDFCYNGDPHNDYSIWGYSIQLDLLKNYCMDFLLIYKDNKDNKNKKNNKKTNIQDVVSVVEELIVEINDKKRLFEDYYPNVMDEIRILYGKNNGNNRNNINNTITELVQTDLSAEDMSEQDEAYRKYIKFCQSFERISQWYDELRSCSIDEALKETIIEKMKYIQTVAQYRPQEVIQSFSDALNQLYELCDSALRKAYNFKDMNTITRILLGVQTYKGIYEDSKQVVISACSILSDPEEYAFTVQRYNKKRKKPC